MKTHMQCLMQCTVLAQMVTDARPSNECLSMQFIHLSLMKYCPMIKSRQSRPSLDLAVTYWHSKASQCNLFEDTSLGRVNAQLWMQDVY